MTDATPPAGTPPAGATVTVELTRAELVAIADALALLAIELHRQRVLARDTTSELTFLDAEADVDALRHRLERAQLDL